MAYINATIDMLLILSDKFRKTHLCTYHRNRATTITWCMHIFSKISELCLKVILWIQINCGGAENNVTGHEEKSILITFVACISKEIRQNKIHQVNLNLAARKWFHETIELLAHVTMNAYYFRCMTASQAWGSEHHVICSQNRMSTRKMPVTVHMKRSLVHHLGYSMLHHVLTVVKILISCINGKHPIKGFLYFWDLLRGSSIYVYTSQRKRSWI
jgi:hypothetical protein